MADRTVTIEIDFDDDGAITSARKLDRGLDQAERSAKKFGVTGSRTFNLVRRGAARLALGVKTVTSATSRLARGFFQLRTLILAVFVGAAARAIQGFVGQTVELEQAQFRLAAALRAAQQRFGPMVGSIRDALNFIPKLRRQFKQFSNVELTGTAASIAELQRNFGLTREQADKLFPRLIDISAATGRTIEDVVTRIRSGFLGSTEAIEDLGINFKINRLESEALAAGYRGQFIALDDVTQAQIRFNTVMKDTAELQGTAVKAADTLGGRVLTLKAAFSDFTLLLSQAVTQTKLFKTLLTGLEQLVGLMTGEVTELGPVGKFVLSIINNILGVVGGIVNVIAKFPLGLIGALLTGNLKNPLEFFSKLTDVFMTGFRAAQLTIEQFTPSVTDILQDAFGEGLQAKPVDVDRAIDDVSKVADALQSELLGVRQGTIGGLFDLPAFIRTITEARKLLSKAQTENQNRLGVTAPEDVGGLAAIKDRAIAIAELDEQLRLLLQTQVLLGQGQFNQQLIDNLDKLGIAYEDVVVKGSKFRIGLAELEVATLNFADRVTNVLLSIFTSFGDLIADAVAGTDEPLKKFLAGLLGTLGSFAIQLGGLMILLGLGLTALFSLNPGALVAVGAALVAIGGLLKGFSSRLAGTARGGGGAGATFQQNVARPIAPQQIDLASINPQQGAPQSGAHGSAEMVDLAMEVKGLVSDLRVQAPGVLVKDGVGENGGVAKLMNSRDNAVISRRVLNTNAL